MTERNKPYCLIKQAQPSTIIDLSAQIGIMAAAQQFGVTRQAIEYHTKHPSRQKSSENNAGAQKKQKYISEIESIFSSQGPNIGSILQKLYVENGLSTREIARFFSETTHHNIGKNAINNWLHDYQIKIRKTLSNIEPNNKLNSSQLTKQLSDRLQVQNPIELFKNQLQVKTQTQIAKDIKVHQATLRKWLKILEINTPLPQHMRSQKSVNVYRYENPTSINLDLKEFDQWQSQLRQINKITIPTQLVDQFYIILKKINFPFLRAAIMYDHELVQIGLNQDEIKSIHMIYNHNNISPKYSQITPEIDILHLDPEIYKKIQEKNIRTFAQLIGSYPHLEQDLQNEINRNLKILNRSINKWKKSQKK